MNKTERQNKNQNQHSSGFCIDYLTGCCKVYVNQTIRKGKAKLNMTNKTPTRQGLLRSGSHRRCEWSVRTTLHFCKIIFLRHTKL